jgi:hypothetical protein
MDVGTWLMSQSALLAEDMLVYALMPSLPQNQWELEITLWFQTSLANMQAGLVEWPARQGHLQSAYAKPIHGQEIVDDPPGIRAAYVSQCKNQMIQSSGEVQSFSVLGLVIVFLMTGLLVLLAMSLEKCMFILRSGSTSDRTTSRQTDDKLHLLRIALESSEKSDIQWQSGTLEVPIMPVNMEFERPKTHFNGLASYGL